MERNELFFEDIFESLIKESQNISIEYDYVLHYFKEESYATYEIKKINDVSPYMFQNRIQQFGKEGLKKLNEELKYIDFEFRISFLESIKVDLLSLRNIVKEETFVYEESEYGPREEKKFKSFMHSILKPFNEERKNGHAKSILLKSSEYAEKWIEGIEEIASKVGFIINQIELMPEPKDAIKDKNTITLFFSWQSDNDDERRTIWRVLRKVEEFYKAKGKTILIESDMRGVPGSQDIPNTLFRKIEECDIFFADVNLVYKSLSREDCLSPNPNVLIELGYAASKLDWDRVILILNTNINKIEQLPFDIRQRAILWYTSEEELINKLKFALKEIIKEENGG
jgi:hypothetical protein